MTPTTLLLALPTFLNSKDTFSHNAQWKHTSATLVGVRKILYNRIMILLRNIQWDRDSVVLFFHIPTISAEVCFHCVAKCVEKVHNKTTILLCM